MSQISSSSPIKNDIVLGVDGKPKNKAYTNMFQEEIILTEKQKLRIDLVQNKSKMKKLIKSMTPSDLFTLFDEDDSGLISFEEFRKMLPYLDIIISDAKAFRYFRLCDSDGSGEIDFDEFKVALFICDPVSIYLSSSIIIMIKALLITIRSTLIINTILKFAMIMHLYYISFVEY